MQTVNNITLLGTSHIASTSIRELNEIFLEINPDIIAVELDKTRLHGLLSGAKPSYNPRMIGQIGVFGYLFAVIGAVMQKKLGQVVGISPGSEMKAAANLARNNNKKLALIDQNIQVTLRRLSQEFTFKQKMRLVWDILSSPFSKKMRIDLSKVPEKKMIDTILKLLKVRYPGLYTALIDERNKFMVSKLLAISVAYPDSKILVVIGAGHEEGMMELFKQSQVSTFQNKI